MRKLLISASAIALVATAAACGQSTDAVDTSAYNEDASVVVADNSAVEPVETIDTASVNDEYMMSATEHRASTLIGSPVTNTAGEEIATVADLYLGEGVEKPMVVVRDGGVAGAGGTLHLLAFDQATFTPQADDEEPKVSFQVSDDGLEALPKFEQDGMDDFRLASEMIGTNAKLSFSDDIARVNDLLIGNDGAAKYAVVSKGVAGGDEYVIPASAVTVSQGDGEDELVIDLDADGFATAQVLRNE